MADEAHMRRCLDLARQARDADEVPVGALIAQDDEIVAEGMEAVKARRDPAAHAEIEAIRAACQALNTLDLTGMTLVTTVEPCWMCSFAVREVHMARVIIGARLPSIGGVSSDHPILTLERPDWGQPPRILRDVLRRECEALHDASS